MYPKDTHEWLTWIQKNKALYLNKEKIQALIAQQQTNPADVNYLDLDLISKIVRDFQNASVDEENSSRFSVAPDDAFVQAWAKVLLPVVSTQYINAAVLHFQSLFSKKRIFYELLLFAAALLIVRAFLCLKEKKRKPEQKCDLLRRTAVLRVMACSGSMIQCLNRIRCPDRQPIWDPV